MKSNGKSHGSALTLAALGVVYGDIGTSPLYAFKEAFSGTRGLPLDEAGVLAVLSLMFWSLMLIVSLKYVTLMLRFDNRGEGGILALLALASGHVREHPRLAWTVATCGVFGASLFYGDALLTPAISVLSAVEGISVATPALDRWIVPATVGIVIALFSIQVRGTGAVGKLFGPCMVLWFSVLAVLGGISIAQTPVVLASLDPRHALGFAWQHPLLAFFVLGAVFLAITGAEALYADMGHFGAKPIRLAWFGMVFPALMINYIGQGALVLRDPAAIKNPFYLLAPPELLFPLVVLGRGDRKSTRLNSSHVEISYAVFCLKKKNKYTNLNANIIGYRVDVSTVAEIRQTADKTNAEVVAIDILINKAGSVVGFYFHEHSHNE